MSVLTEVQIKKIAAKTKDVPALVAALTEEPYLKSGQAVTINGSMGQLDLAGKFVEENNGWAKIKREDGTEFWCLYHQVMPKDKGFSA